MMQDGVFISGPLDEFLRDMYDLDDEVVFRILIQAFQVTRERGFEIKIVGGSLVVR